MNNEFIWCLPLDSSTTYHHMCPEHICPSNHTQIILVMGKIPVVFSIGSLSGFNQWKAPSEIPHDSCMHWSSIHPLNYSNTFQVPTWQKRAQSEKWLDGRVPDHFTWRTAMTAKSVMCFRGKFDHSHLHTCCRQSRKNILVLKWNSVSMFTFVNVYALSFIGNTFFVPQTRLEYRKSLVLWSLCRFRPTPMGFYSRREEFTQFDS